MAVGEGERALPSEVGAQEVGGVGAVRLQTEPLLRAVFAPPIVIEEQVLRGVRGHLVESSKREVVTAGRAEHLTDERAVERLFGNAPIARDRPHLLLARVTRDARRSVRKHMNGGALQSFATLPDDHPKRRRSLGSYEPGNGHRGDPRAVDRFDREGFAFGGLDAQRERQRAREGGRQNAKWPTSYGAQR